MNGEVWASLFQERFVSGSQQLTFDDCCDRFRRRSDGDRHGA